MKSDVKVDSRKEKNWEGRDLEAAIREEEAFFELIV
jgi:hypothetical protein